VDGFIGRERELAILDGKLSKVRASRQGPAGQVVLIRGRRRVGKSRLVEQFVERAGVPHVFFTAVGGNRDEDLVGFTQEITTSDLPEGGVRCGLCRSHHLGRGIPCPGVGPAAGVDEHRRDR
jgi:hypothetical protein